MVFPKTEKGGRSFLLLMRKFYNEDLTGYILHGAGPFVRDLSSFKGDKFLLGKVSSPPSFIHKKSKWDFNSQVERRKNKIVGRC